MVQEPHLRFCNYRTLDHITLIVRRSQTEYPSILHSVSNALQDFYTRYIKLRSTNNLWVQWKIYGVTNRTLKKKDIAQMVYNPHVAVTIAT